MASPCLSSSDIVCCLINQSINQSITQSIDQSIIQSIVFIRHFLREPVWIQHCHDTCIPLCFPSHAEFGSLDKRRYTVFFQALSSRTSGFLTMESHISTLLLMPYIIAAGLVLRRSPAGPINLIRLVPSLFLSYLFFIIVSHSSFWFKSSGIVIED